ncbi:MAG: SagB/ThcOx family dehydrogenase [Magnetococcales bacterium]|nr:SagB/ThcOx family dehydrogenase [Magnetococcales bacterium]
MSDHDQRIATVLGYHRQTKHRPNRYASGPGFLDWESQPDPFRHYLGAKRRALPLVADTLGVPYAHLGRPGRVAPAPLDGAGLAALLEISLGLAAWKSSQGVTWPLRCNPSSGNLHPTEGYVVIADLPAPPGGRPAALEAGVYHYSSRDHLLERRTLLPETAQVLLPGTFLVGLTSIHWREAWKYGERAWRYCQLDVGHAMAAVRYGAAVLGWRARLLADPGDAAVGNLLGLTQDPGAAEAEHPDLLLLVDASSGPPVHLSAERIRTLAETAARRAGWEGEPNRLSREHKVDWPIIDRIAAATLKPATRENLWWPGERPALEPSPTTAGAVTLIRGRRSGQAYDGQTALAGPAFFRTLDRLLPRREVPPWDLLPWSPRVHPVFMVHRVTGLAPGLYLLVRDAAAEPRLRAALDGGCQWERPAGCPADLDFYRLRAGDLRETAAGLSCQQEIAADGAYSVGMLGAFEPDLSGAPWSYRRLFWEAGLLGQVLYLEAEAEGIRGTGIGCFFDDGFHELLGLQGEGFQSLYHFTAGGALEDARLETLPPYAFLPEEEGGQ